ncbi:MAG: AEC family transporter [Pseudomonadota bacterium]
MNLFLTVLEITAPVFLLAALGFGWVRAGLAFDTRFVTQLTTYVSVPCLIFVALVEMDINRDTVARLVLATVLGYALLTFASWLIVRLGRLEPRTYLAPIIMGNTGNIGLPIALFAFGDQGLAFALVVFAIMGTYAFTGGIWMVSGHFTLKRALTDPLVLSTLAGLLFWFFSWDLPSVMSNAAGLLGQMAIPLMLLTLGVAVSRLKIAQLSKAMVISIVRLVVCIVCGIIAAKALNLPPVQAAVLIVQISTPVAVTSYLIADQHGANSEDVAGLVVVSTALSVITLPLTLAFLL